MCVKSGRGAKPHGCDHFVCSLFMLLCCYYNIDCVAFFRRWPSSESDRLPSPCLWPITVAGWSGVHSLVTPLRAPLYKAARALRYQFQECQGLEQWRLGAVGHSRGGQDRPLLVLSFRIDQLPCLVKGGHTPRLRPGWKTPVLHLLH